MPFIILGTVLAAFGIVFLRLTKQAGDASGAYGSVVLIIAGVLVALIFGVFYRLVG